MKKKHLLFLLLFLKLHAEIKIDQTSRSFIFIKPICNSLSFNNTLWHEGWFDNQKKHAFQISSGYQESFKSEKIAPYFLMNNQSSLLIRGSGHTNYAKTDTNVRAEWLGLPNDFQGTLTVKPEQWQACWNLSFRKNFGKLFDAEFFNRMWLFCDVPVVMIKNNMNVTQSDVTGTASSGSVTDIVTAFNNSNWKYQKMRTSSKKIIKPAYVKVGFGSTFLSTNRAHAAMYSALAVPTHKTQNNRYLFDPQAGLNGHLAMVSGASLQLPLNRETDYKQNALFLNLETTYLIRNKQYRTFDLKDKQWSRFLLLREKDQTTDATTPGVNVLTQKVRVSGYALIDAIAGVRLNVGSAQAEFGFGVWGHNQERIKLNTAWQETYGIAGSTTNTSATQSTIKTRASNDASFTTIKESDLNIDSAKSPATVLYKAHCSIGARGRGKNGTVFFGAGSFLEIPLNTTKALHNWGVWAKLGAAF